MRNTILQILLIAVAAAGFAAGDALHAQQPGDIRVEAPGESTRMIVNLPKALFDRDITFHLGWQDGKPRQAWGFASGSTKVIDAVDASKLTFKDGKLGGSLTCRVNLDGDPQTHRLNVDFDAQVTGRDLAGTYKGRHSVLTDSLVYETDSYVLEPGEFSLFHYGQKLKGKATARWQKPADKDKADLTIWTRHALKGVASWQRYVTFRVSVADGKAADVKVEPTNDNTGWNAAVQKQDLRFDGEKFIGSVTFKVATPDTAGVQAGVYRFVFDARVQNNVLKGATEVYLNDKRISGGVGLAGTASGGPAEGKNGRRIQVIHMPRAIEVVRDLQVHMVYDADRFVSGVAFHPTFPDWFEAKPLKEGPGVVVHFSENSYMTAKKDALTVTYQLSFSDKGKNRTGTYSCRFGRQVESGGKLRGKVADLNQLHAANAIAKGCDWPFWNGPRSSFAATPTERRLVDDLKDARLVWVGEDIPPARCQTTRYGEGNLVRFLERGGSSGGGCSPVLADGKVYLYYFQPSGGKVGDYVKQMADKKQHVLRKMWLTKADDVVVCMDAATGKTLWKTTFPNQGRYYGYRGTGRAKGAYTANLAVGDGKVVVHGTSGRTYCLEAETGKSVWTSPRGGGALRIIAADVVVASGSDVVALDLNTGKQRWAVKDAGSATAIPVRWEHDDKEYLVCGTRGGKLTCIEAATGKVLWQQTDSGDNSYSMALHGDVLLGNGAGYGKRKPMQLAAWQLSLTGAKRLWMIPAKTKIYNPYKAPAAAADGHAFVRLSKANRVYAVDISSGKVVQDVPTPVGSAGYVFWTDDRVAVQPDASHSQTAFWWFDVSKPSAMRRARQLWPARHRTTSSYYPVLMSHAIADGRIFIRGQRGIVCYDLRAKEESAD